jgi:pyruvate/2-oxoglutarate dehydrogenase complex dihydrolipoamide acyltransferase (E2) component
VPAPLQGTVIACSVAKGDRIHAGQQVLVIEAMKMEHLVASPVGGIVEEMLVAPGDTIFEGEAMLHVVPSDDANTSAETVQAIDLDHIRGDLAEALARRAELLDENRPDAAVAPSQDQSADDA